MQKIYFRRTRHKCSVSNCHNKNVIYVGKSQESSRATYLCDDCIARLFNFSASGDNRRVEEIIKDADISEEVIQVETIADVEQEKAQEPVAEEIIAEPTGAEIIANSKTISNVFALRKYMRELGMSPADSSTRLELLQQIEDKFSE